MPGRQKFRRSAVAGAALILAAACGPPRMRLRPGSDHVMPQPPRLRIGPDSTPQQCGAAGLKDGEACRAVKRDTMPDPSRGVGVPVRKTP
jgi:hypothetical protein